MNPEPLVSINDEPSPIAENLLQRKYGVSLKTHIAGPNGKCAVDIYGDKYEDFLFITS